MGVPAAALLPYDSSRDPEPPAGGVILNVFARALARDDAGRLLYKTAVARSREAGRDHLWLTELEWRSLVPARARRGETFPVPAPLTDRICRRYLIDLVRVGGNGGPRRHDQVLAEQLRLTVEEATATRVSLRLDGTARLATHDPNGGAGAKEPDPDGASVDRAARAPRRGRRETGPGAELDGRRRAAGPVGPSPVSVCKPAFFSLLFISPRSSLRTRAMPRSPGHQRRGRGPQPTAEPGRVRA
jgi:hypothetical protein